MRPFRYRADAPLLLLALLMGLMLGVLSVARYAGYNAGMLDLGNMAQAIWSGTQGKPLVVTFPDGPLSRLAHHVELIYWLFVPFYALWPDPRLLVGVQAALFAAGALPLFWLALRRTDSVWIARAMATSYLLSPTAMSGVLFDLHGDTLAMPLLLFALEALDARAWRRYALFVVLALACKFYVAVPVAGIGGWLLLWGGADGDTTRSARATLRRAGAATLAAAVGYGALTFFVVRPLFASGGGVAETSGSYLAFYFGDMDEVARTAGDRLLSAIVIFGPTMLLAWRGWRWLLAGLPLALAMLLSSGPGGAYDFRYHHYATVVPFVLMATLEGTARRKQAQEARAARGEPRRGRPWHGDLVLCVGTVLLAGALLVDTPLNPLFWLGLPAQGLDSAAYGITPRDGMKDRFIAQVVPPRAPMASSVLLAPHHARRDTLYLVRYPDDPGAERLPALLPQVDYVLADALFDWYVPLDGDAYGGGVAYEHEAIGVVLRNPQFALVRARDGLLLFQRDAPPGAPLAQQVEQVGQADAGSMPPLRATMGAGAGAVGLIDAQVEPVASISAPRRFRATFEWVRLPAAQAGGANAAPPRMVAVSHLEGVPNARIVHLPTGMLLPVDEWQPGARVRETFEVDMPHDIPAGRYEWRVGWYATNQASSHTTDVRTRMGAEVVITTITIPPE